MRPRGSSYASTYAANRCKSMILKEKLCGSSYACITPVFHSLVHLFRSRLAGVPMRQRLASLNAWVTPLARHSGSSYAFAAGVPMRPKRVLVMVL